MEIFKIAILFFKDEHCSMNIDECESDPCINGDCLDMVNGYECQCLAGYTDPLCSTEIDECDVWTPCENGATCSDGINNYECVCPEMVDGVVYSGKNCTVLLTSCDTNPCENQAPCEPVLIDEDSNTQEYKCHCLAGTVGDNCQVLTDMKFDTDDQLFSPLSILLSSFPSDASNFNMKLDFRTTLSEVILFKASRNDDAHFTLALNENSLSCSHYMPSAQITFPLETDRTLNDGEWHQINFSFMPSNSIEIAVVMSDTEEFSTIQIASFFEIQNVNFGGGLLEDYSNYTGCLRDVQINGKSLRPKAYRTSTPEGCLREEQCAENTCNFHGDCTDLWVKYTCQCHRKYYGKSCENGNYIFVCAYVYL